MKKENLKYVGVAGVAGVALVFAGAGGAVAGQMINGSNIKPHTITARQLAKGSVNNSALGNSAITWNKVDPGMRTRIQGLVGKRGTDGKDGKDGKDGTNGTNGTNGKDGAPGAAGPVGPAGPAGPAASDVFGKLAGEVKTASAVTIAHIGGSFASRSTDLGTMTLQPGTYLINADGYFDRDPAHDADPSLGTTLELVVRASDGSPLGTDAGPGCFTPVVPVGDREVTCSTTRIVTVATPTIIDVRAFGYNDATDPANGEVGDNYYNVNADVSAVQVG